MGNGTHHLERTDLLPRHNSTCAQFGFLAIRGEASHAKVRSHLLEYFVLLQRFTGLLGVTQVPMGFGIHQKDLKWMLSMLFVCYVMHPC
jgi:hypothetical protein